MERKCNKCETELKLARGIGLYCPNDECRVIDDIKSYSLNDDNYKQTMLKALLWELKVITQKIEKLMK